MVSGHGLARSSARLQIGTPGLGSHLEARLGTGHFYLPRVFIGRIHFLEAIGQTAALSLKPEMERDSSESPLARMSHFYHILLDRSESQLPPTLRERRSRKA